MNLEMRFVNDIAGRFFVPSYQRGYRWTKDEVVRLLDDVCSLNDSKQKYCLQPVVVKKLDDTRYEVIDGQQRLTTLFLICKHMHLRSSGFFYAPKFSLNYETRMASANFLADMDLSLRNTNIDFFFMANACEAVKEWFGQQTNFQSVMNKINNYFCDNIQVIWYEVDADEDSIDMFTRLNIGKIPLTSAELVKAMFLSSKNVDSRKRDEIALQWDNIEKELHNDSLWYFLTNNAETKYNTRIDLILDLIAAKNPDEKDKYYTFYYFANETDLKVTWQNILQTFNRLKDWHEDHEHYHKIGYLIASEAKTLSELYTESRGKNKREFLLRLDKLIKDSVALRGNEDSYSDWNYDDDAEKIRRLLLLFNVESVRQNGEQSQWFPFDKFKFGDDNKSSWSLEHIHAVKSQERGTQEEWREWLRLHLPSLDLLSDDKNLVAEVRSMLKRKLIGSQDFEPLRDKIIAKLSPVNDNEKYLNSISNLALLKGEDNSALSNSVFDVKRNEIVNMDMCGKFIPFCTKMAFLKYYTKSEQNQVHLWGADDRRAYVKAMNDILRDYLSKLILYEES